MRGSYRTQDAWGQLKGETGEGNTLVRRGKVTNITSDKNTRIIVRTLHLGSIKKI